MGKSRRLRVVFFTLLLGAAFFALAPTPVSAQRDCIAAVHYSWIHEEYYCDPPRKDDKVRCTVWIHYGVLVTYDCREMQRSSDASGN